MKLFAVLLVVFTLISGSTLPAFAAEVRCSNTDLIKMSKKLKAREEYAKKGFDLWGSGQAELNADARKAAGVRAITVGVLMMAVFRSFWKHDPSIIKGAEVSPTALNQQISKLATFLGDKVPAGEIPAGMLHVGRYAAGYGAVGGGFILGGAYAAVVPGEPRHAKSTVDIPSRVDGIFKSFNQAHQDIAEKRRAATNDGAGGVWANLRTLGKRGATVAQAFSQESLDHTALFLMEMSYAAEARKIISDALQEGICQNRATYTDKRQKHLQERLDGVITDLVSDYNFGQALKAGIAQ